MNDHHSYTAAVRWPALGDSVRSERGTMHDECVVCSCAGGTHTHAAAPVMGKT